MDSSMRLHPNNDFALSQASVLSYSSLGTQASSACRSPDAHAMTKRPPTGESFVNRKTQHYPGPGAHARPSRDSSRWS